MYNDSLDTLLLRHYGSNGPVPEALEQHVSASVQVEAKKPQQSQRIASRMREQRISRRRVIQMFALGSAGFGALGAGISSVQTILQNQDGSQPAYL
jgi:hypothetical protein